jgi:hypothetical protein
MFLICKTYLGLPIFEIDKKVVSGIFNSNFIQLTAHIRLLAKSIV